MRLLKLPLRLQDAVRSGLSGPSGHFLARIAATISLTVVLPQLPVMPMTTWPAILASRRRRNAARSPRACWVSGTTIWLTPVSAVDGRHPFDHQACRAIRHGLFGKIMGIVIFSPQSDKETVLRKPTGCRL